MHNRPMDKAKGGQDLEWDVGVGGAGGSGGGKMEATNFQY